MRPVVIGHRAAPRLKQLRAAGHNLEPLNDVLHHLARGTDRPGWNDHALKGRLRGRRSVVVGFTVPGDRTIVLVYRDQGRRVIVDNLGEHDDVYREELEARRLR